VGISVLIFMSAAFGLLLLLYLNGVSPRVRARARADP
jgi:hypothetical protein